MKKILIPLLVGVMLGCTANYLVEKKRNLEQQRKKDEEDELEEMYDETLDEEGGEYVEPLKFSDYEF